MPTAGVWLLQLGAIGFALALGVTSAARDPGLVAVIATATFLLGGLPHGAFDIHLAASRAQLGRSQLAIFTAIYFSLVALMLLGWAVAPALVLPLFLLSAAFHFGADWPETREPLFRAALGFAPICAIAVGHLPEVERIFSAMTTPAIALWSKELLILAAPVTGLIAGTALVVMAQSSGWRRPAVFAVLLASLVVLPPLIGFALFFCAFHTPQHLIALRTELAHWPKQRLIAVGAGMTGLALAIGAIALPLTASGGILTAASGFQLLAALAMPHQSMKFILSHFN